MKSKYKHLLTIILSLILIAGLFFKRHLDHSKKLQQEEILQASDKLQQVYYVLNSYLLKIDDFSRSYINEYIPERKSICSKQKNTERFNNSLSDIVTQKINAIDYEMGFYGDVIEAIDMTELYTQDLKTPNELKSEKNPDGFARPRNYEWYINSQSRSNKYANNEGWNIKLMGAIDFDFQKCIVSSDDLEKKFKVYNDMMKNDVKKSMGKIENFYKKNNLNLSDLKNQKF